MKMVGSKTIRKKQTPREGCNQTSVGLIPDEWKKLKLSEVCIKIQDGTHFSPKTVANGQRLYITSKNVRIGKLDLSNVDYISEEDHNNIYKRCDVKRNDILLTKDGANTGNACINNLDDEFSLLSSVAFLRPDKSVTDFKFLYQLLVSPKSQYLIKESMAGQAITRITLNKLKSFQFYFPPLPEQQKIAAILSTWDEAIEKTQSLIDQLRQRNKGLAQQLLTGKKRLKGFSDAWTTVHIYQIAEPLNMINKEGLALDVLSCTKYSGLVKSLDYFGKRVYGADLRKYKIVPKGTFAYATNHIEEGSIGYQKFSEDCLISPMYTVFRTNGTVNDGFLLRLLKSDKMIYAYQSNMSGSINRRGGLRWKDFSSILITIPGIKEQIAIHGLLSQSDHELKMHEQHLMVLRQQKKGLMQNLLTGKIRVKPNS